MGLADDEKREKERSLVDMRTIFKYRNHDFGVVKNVSQQGGR